VKQKCIKFLLRGWQLRRLEGELSGMSSDLNHKLLANASLKYQEFKQ